ncbi:MAG: hypothetical protein EHM91_05595, partial [Planctomycetota bacterium]
RSEPAGEHARSFDRERTSFDPWHYVPALATKPGALRNGAPFKDWALPQPIQRPLTTSAARGGRALQARNGLSESGRPCRDRAPSDLPGSPGVPGGDRRATCP